MRTYCLFSSLGLGICLSIYFNCLKLKNLFLYYLRVCNNWLFHKQVTESKFRLVIFVHFNGEIKPIIGNTFTLFQVDQSRYRKITN